MKTRKSSPAPASLTSPRPPRRGKKTWQEKLDADKGLPKVVKLNPTAAKRWGGRTMAIPAPREVDGLMQRIPRGKLSTINELRTAIARRHHAAVGCPITTGIFSWIAAHAAAEAAAAGARSVTPYWRVLKNDGELNPKYPGGIDGLTARLNAEGHEVCQKGKRFFVRDYEKAVKVFAD